MNTVLSHLSYLPNNITICSGACGRGPPSLFPPRPFAILNRIGSGTCDRETRFLFTPPFHHIIKKLLAPVRVTEKHRFSSPRPSTLLSKKLYTPHQQQHYIYLLIKRKVSHDFWCCSCWPPAAGLLTPHTETDILTAGCKVHALRRRYRTIPIAQQCMS